MSAPPTSGPTIAPAMTTVMLRLVALGSRCIGTIRGRIAVRTGWLTAKNDCWRAKIASSSQTLSRASAACTQNSTAVPMRPAVVMSSRVRRSIESASAPPHRPNTTSGTRPKMPVRPTIADDSVIE